jgi:hypothetical protein
MLYGMRREMNVIALDKRSLLRTRKVITISTCRQFRLEAFANFLDGKFITVTRSNHFHCELLCQTTIFSKEKWPKAPDPRLWDARHRWMSFRGEFHRISGGCIHHREKLQACSILASSFEGVFSFPAGLSLFEKVLTTFQVLLQKTYNSMFLTSASHIKSCAATIIRGIRIHSIVIQ